MKFETEIRDFKICTFFRNIFLMSSSLLTCIFFKYLAFFQCLLIVSYLQIQQTKNPCIREILINHFFAILKVSRPETFETESRKNASRDESQDRDQVSRLHHWLWGLLLSNWMKLNETCFLTRVVVHEKRVALGGSTETFTTIDNYEVSRQPTQTPVCKWQRTSRIQECML